MKNACLPLPRVPWARGERVFPNKVKVKESILENTCYLDSQNECERWKSASFLLNEGCVLSAKGAKNISGNFRFERSSFLSSIT